MLTVLAALAAFGSNPVETEIVTLRRGDLHVSLSETGTTRAVESTTYRSPLAGREIEITFLAPEGTRINEGDLIARLDATELEAEVARAEQAVRQADVDFRVAEVDRQDAQARLDDTSDGQMALTVDEARLARALLQKKAERLKAEYDALRPLLEKGFITREELERSASELEQAEGDLAVARRKAQLLVERRPKETRRAELQVTQRDVQLANARARLEEARSQVSALNTMIANCHIYARSPGVVLYEHNLGVSPRRKVRVGDRVTATQGLITIPDVSQIVIDSSVREADVARVRPGMPVTIRADARPDLPLTGVVSQVGAVGQTASDRAFDEKRFEVQVRVGASDASLPPGATVRIDIRIDGRAQALLLPVNLVFMTEGRPTVRVVGPSGVEPRSVTLGVSNEVYVEVRSGLSEGDRVALPR